ncbi:extended synaptotagmin-2-like isoform X2 [Melanotaenia boesemani]|uniref:extended synaptotagmin-2-like isoform X2 n=1 Tax=Melanotaenia boesemani TaxID=1250792 RepID=UPI001C040C4E|nr:extended synaptotagmin-2-like isoform X2 [Melanotaenia boesemani]
MDGSAGTGIRSNGPTAASKSPAESPQTPPLPPDGLNEEQQSSLTDVTQMWIQFAKTFAIIFPIYVLGYFEFSFSWVLIGLALLFYWRKNYGSKDYRINQALEFLEHEEKAVRQSLPTSQLPSWVHFPDVERVEWVNKTVKQMWPFICQFADKLLRETIEPEVQQANAHLSSFCFTKVDLGDKPPRINGVKVYTENVDKRQVIMDLQISFVGNTEIDVDIRKYYCRAGIKSIQLHGLLRVVLDPLLGDLPLVGAVTAFFLKRPILDINWTGLTNVLDIPGVNGLCDNIIQDIICSKLVLPNSINVSLVSETEMAKLRFPIPKGLLRIHFIEAQEVLSKDKLLGGLIKGKSDPYGVIHAEKHLFQSKVINDSNNPKWNEVYEALIYNPKDHNLQIELFDKDPDEDDYLGSVCVDLIELQKEQKVDEWFALDNVATGKLHLRLEWLSLLPTPEKLSQALMSIRAERGQANDGLSSAVLIIFLESAKTLPSVFEGNLGSGYLKERRAAGLVFCENTASLYRSLFSGKKVTSDPNPCVQFRVGHKSFESKTRYKTNNPVWEEHFTFLIHNPNIQELEVEVKDEKHHCQLGTLTVPLSRLLEAKNMMMHEHFPLKCPGPSSTLKMKMALRVLCLEKDTSLPSNSTPSSVQVRKSSSSSSTPQPSASSESPKSPPFANSDIPRSASVSTHDLLNERWEGEGPTRSLGSTDLVQGGVGKAENPSLAETGRSSSNLAISGSQQFLAGGKEPTPSIASDISNPYSAQELKQRLQQLQNGSGPSYVPLGEIQLTIRHSAPTNKLIVVVHSCRNLIAFTDHGSDPYVRLYLLPDKRRSGRRKTHTHKKTLNPSYDQKFDFSVSLVELPRRTLDVAVKNGGGLFNKHRGLLGKVLVDLTHEEITKGWTQWFELSEDGLKKPHQL